MTGSGPPGFDQNLRVPVGRGQGLESSRNAFDSDFPGDEQHHREFAFGYVLS